MGRHRTTRRVLACLCAFAVSAPAAADVPPLPLLGDGTTIRVSTRADGKQATGDAPGDGDATEPSVSANGRYVVFYTDLNLGLGWCGPGTYLRDLVTGRLEMVSVPAGGCPRNPRPGGSAHSYTSISADGRYVAFASGADDLLVPRRPWSEPPGHPRQVYLRDRLRKRTVLVSAGFDGRVANGTAARPTVSDDGRFVAFESPATNLVRGDTGDPGDDMRTDIFLRDMQRRRTVRVGPNLRRVESSPKLFPSLSGNGRYVVFEAINGTLAPSRGDGGMLGSGIPRDQVYVWDRVTGATELVSRSDDGYAAAGPSTVDAFVGSKISRDGRWITYASTASNLVRPDHTGLQDTIQVYLYDRVAKKVRRVSDGLAGEGGNGESRYPCLSADGRYVSFASAASNLGDVDATPGYNNGFPDPGPGTDVYLYDRDTKRTRLVSRSTEGMPADANSRDSCPSNGGTTVVFISKATNLVSDDTNAVPDAFVRRYPAGS